MLYFHSYYILKMLHIWFYGEGFGASIYTVSFVRRECWRQERGEEDEGDLEKERDVAVS